MKNLVQKEKSNSSKPYPTPLPPIRLSNMSNSGAILLTIVVLIIIVGITGVAIYSLTTTSTFSQVASQNASQAYYLAESGFRVVAAEYNKASKDEASKNTALENLHGKTFNISGSPGQFEARLYPTWFYVSAPYSPGGSPDTIRVKLPGGVPVQNPADPSSTQLTIPDNCELKLQGKTRHAVIIGKTPENPNDGDEITFTLNPGFPYDIATGETLFLVYSDSNTATLNTNPISLGSDLVLDGSNDVAKLFPLKNGSFRIDNYNNDKLDYTYKEAIYTDGTPPTFTLTDIRHQNPDNPSESQFNIDSDTQIFVGKNLTVATTASVGDGTMAGEKTLVSYTDAGLDAGFSTGKETISFDEDIQDFSPKMGTGGTEIPIGDANAPITVDTTAKEIQLGKNLTNRYGSIWYAGDTDIANCVQGRCNLGKGFNAYFEFQFADTDDDPASETYGDGFTFSVISGHEDSPGVYRNTAEDTGSGGEYLGYAGPGLDEGLKPPKIGIEFDTYPNPGAGNICGSDSRRDDSSANHVAAVYWGDENIGSIDTHASSSSSGGFLRIGTATPSNGDPEDWSSTQGTISFWFMRDNPRTSDRMWGQNGNMEMRIASDKLALDWGGDSSLEVDNPFTTAGKWYFLAITWNQGSGGELKMYYGDESTPPYDLVPTFYQWPRNVADIGIAQNLLMNSSGGDEDLEYIVDGKVADLRYYDIERSATSIEGDYATRLSGNEAGLQAYFPIQADLVNLGPLVLSAYPVSKPESFIEPVSWSSDTPSPFDVCDTPAATYDDNRHGSGGIDTPLNSLNTNPDDGNDGYHQVTKEVGVSNWLEDGEVHNCRIELIRPPTPNVDGNYDYQFKIWIDCGGDCSLLTPAELESYQSLIGNYTFSASLPQIQKTLNDGNPLEVTPGIHEDLEKILFGFTEGTGGASQNIILSNFELYFLQRYPVTDLSIW